MSLGIISMTERIHCCHTRYVKQSLPSLRTFWVLCHWIFCGPRTRILKFCPTRWLSRRAQRRIWRCAAGARRARAQPACLRGASCGPPQSPRNAENLPLKLTGPESESHPELFSVYFYLPLPKCTQLRVPGEVGLLPNWPQRLLGTFCAQSSALTLAELLWTKRPVHAATRVGKIMDSIISIWCEIMQYWIRNHHAEANIFCSTFMQKSYKLAIRTVT